MSRSDFNTCAWMLALSLPLSSCSLVVDVELPTQGDDSNCAQFNDELPDGVTPCVKWQFNAGTLECELVPLDRDNDGFYPAICVHDPVAAITEADVDCDDGAANGAVTYPKAPELCDGVDNDCDGRIDEGAFVPRLSNSPTITFTGSPNDVAYASDAQASDSVGVAYALPGTSSVPGAVVRDRGTSSENADRFSVFTADAANSTAIKATDSAIVADGVDIAALGNNQYAVAFINPNGGRRVVAGVVTQDRAKNFFAETSVMDGLPCAPSDGDCSVTRPPVGRPVVGVSGTDVLVTSVRQTIVANECDESVDDVAVIGNALVKKDFARVTLPGGGGQLTAFPALRSTTENLLGFDVGTVRADATPAVIGIAGVGFVVALPQTDNRLLLRTVTVIDKVYAVDESRDVLLSLEGNSQPLLEPSLAVSTAIDHDNDDETPARQVLALAFRRGCGGAGTVHVKLFDINPDNGKLMARSGAAGAPRKLDGTGLGTAISESRPSITFAPEQGNTWFVAYAKQKDLRARVLSFDGTLEGEENYLLIEGADRIGLTPAVFPTPSTSFGGARFGAMIDATVDGDNGIYTIHLGCFDSGS